MTRSRMAIGIAGLCAVALVAAYCGQDTKFSAQAQQRAYEHRRAIQAEIKSLGKHAWAGEYYEGDGLGVGISLALAPQAGYAFEWYGCGGVYDRNFGGVSVIKGQASVVLHVRERTGRIPRHLVRIHSCVLGIESLPHTSPRT